MTVTSIQKDTAGATIAITAEFDAHPEQVWQLWADPRLLERWWGPPTYPATFVDHHLGAGGGATYYMTGPEGERYHGLWRVVEVDAPTRLAFEDSFADDAGNANPDLPTTSTVVTIAGRDGGGTTMTILSTFPSPEAMDQLLGMGMEEGLAAALGQMDGLLAAAG